MSKDIIKPNTEESSSEHLSLEKDSNSIHYCLKGANVFSQKNENSPDNYKKDHIEEASVPEAEDIPEPKNFFSKFKDGFKVHSQFYISAILAIAFAASTYFAISFYIELRTAKKTISVYETEFSDALNMYKDLKNAVDQKMERRYELIHKKYPNISKIQFEKIQVVFAEQGNKDYTRDRLESSFGYSPSMSRRIYDLWYEA